MKIEIMKVFSVGLVSIFGVVLLSGAGCSSPVTTLTGQLTTEDKCVEVIATGLLAMTYGQNMTALGNLQLKLDDLKAQYGWSDEDIETICQPLYEQEGFMNRVGEREGELIIEMK